MNTRKIPTLTYPADTNASSLRLEGVRINLMGEAAIAEAVFFLKTTKSTYIYIYINIMIPSISIEIICWYIDDHFILIRRERYRTYLGERRGLSPGALVAGEATLLIREGNTNLGYSLPASLWRATCNLSSKSKGNSQKSKQKSIVPNDQTSAYHY